MFAKILQWGLDEDVDEEEEDDDAGGGGANRRRLW
jgi:hypothetical protein